MSAAWTITIKLLQIKIITEDHFAKYANITTICNGKALKCVKKIV